MNFIEVIIVVSLLDCTIQHPNSRRRPEVVDSMWSPIQAEFDDAYDKASEEVSVLSDEGSATLTEITASASDTLKSTEEYVGSSFSEVSDGVNNAAEEAKELATKSYNEVTGDVSQVVDETENFFSSSWNSVSSWFSGAASSVGNFFSSAWGSIKSWWTELEEEVKDFIHLILKIVNILIAGAIFIFILWILFKVRKGYNLVARQVGTPQIL